MSDAKDDEANQKAPTLTPVSVLFDWLCTCQDCIFVAEARSTQIAP